jgi:hypothetical protein
MSAASIPADTPTQLSGTVALHRQDLGSKSERDAVVMVTAAGDSTPLRRIGGHPLRDEVLTSLVGRTLTLQGWQREDYFLIAPDQLL